MNKDNMLKGICKLQLNSISDVDNDPLLKKLTFSIIDFEVSGNRQIIDKDLATESAPTLRGKPLLCVYTPSTNTQEPNDHFNGHGEETKVDRYGNEYIGYNSIAIGSALEGGYIGTIKDDNENDIEVLLCDFYVWCDRNIEILQLINEIYESGLPLYSSCEYWYYNYSVNDGITTIQSPLLFSGHAILDSGENGSTAVAPAYDSSKLISINERWNKAVAEAIKQNNQQSSQVDKADDIQNTKKEVNNLGNEMFKKVCELSFDDIRSLLYGQLRSALSETEYEYSWITETYEAYFVVSYWNNDDHKYYKVTYTKTDNAVTIDWDGRVEVALYQEWREFPEAQNMLNELSESKNKVEEMTNQLNTLKTEKESIESQFNDATEKITSLNAKVAEMTPVVEQHNIELVEKAINEKKEYYSVKFKAVNAVEKFESEEVQELITKSINNDDEGKEAILTLNTMLVDLVQIKVDGKEAMVKEIASKQENLIPADTDFESRYGI